MKTLSNPQILKAALATIVVLAFVTLAVIHIIHLTNAGLIDWKN